MSDNDKAPVVKFRIGLVTANVWHNVHDDRDFFTVNLTRTYKDGDGNLQSSAGLGHADLLNAAKLLKRAETWIGEQRAEQ